MAVYRVYAQLIPILTAFIFSNVQKTAVNQPVKGGHGEGSGVVRALKIVLIALTA